MSEQLPVSGLPNIFGPLRPGVAEEYNLRKMIEARRFRGDYSRGKEEYGR